MIVHFAMAAPGVRPFEHSYAPFFWVELPDIRLLLHPNLGDFIEVPMTRNMPRCLYEEISEAKFMEEKLPMMLAAAEKNNRTIDEWQLRRFLSYVREKPTAAPPVRVRERPVQVVTPGASPPVRVRERPAAPIATTPAPRVRERSRTAEATASPPPSNPAAPGVTARERVRNPPPSPPPSAPPPTRVRERTRG